MANVRLENEHGTPQAVALSDRVHWIGALDPNLRTFDIILKTANGTTYNAYVIRGSEGVAVIDTVKEGFASDFFARLESVADYSEIKVIVLNHLEPDHTGALPELMRCAPQAQLFISQKAQSMLKGLLKQEELSFTPVLTGDSVSLGDRALQFLHTPYLHWPDTQCTFSPEEQILFSGDVFGCHFCDNRLFNDQVGDFRFSLAVVNLKTKLGGVFGSYGWTGEGVRMVEDRLRGLKLRVPIAGFRVKLIPTDEEILQCEAFGLELAQELMGLRGARVVNFEDL